MSRLQVCISFSSVLFSGASLFLPCSQKMPLLTCFWQRSLTAKQLLHGARGRKTATLTLRPLLRGYSLAGSWALVEDSSKGFCRNPRGIFPNKFSGEHQRSRLSFPATGPPDPGTDFKAPGSLTHHRSRHLLEGFSKAF